MKSELVALELADPAERWSALGFAVADDVIELDGVSLTLGAGGEGIVGWTVSGLGHDLDGLPTRPAPSAGRPVAHPNGAIGIDHVVVLTDDFSRTTGALTEAGLELRRTTQRGERRIGFRRLGRAILELVEAPGHEGRARFWGLTIVVEDLPALAARLGRELGPIGAAVQPGRQIATLRESAGLTQPLAFMDPEKR